MTTKTLTKLLIVAVLSGFAAAYADEDPIHVAMETARPSPSSRSVTRAAP